MSQVTVYVRGGVVQDVDTPPSVIVAVQDYDTEGLGEDDGVQEDKDGRFIRSIWESRATIPVEPVNWSDYMVPYSEYWRTVAGPQANQEGWDVFDTDGTLQIQKVDDAEDGHVQLTDDGQAYQHCLLQALQGSRLHILALYLDGRLCDATEPILVPRNLIEP